MSEHTLHLDPEDVTRFVDRCTDEIRARVAPLLEQRLLFAKTIVRVHERDAQSQIPLGLRPFDFACRQCCPVDGCWADDSVSEGFVCAYHQAKKLLESSNG